MNDSVMMRAKGSNGTIELLYDHVRIRREGWLTAIYSRQEPIEVYIPQITSVEMAVKAGGMAGYLALHDDAGREAFEDLTIAFMRPQQAAFEQIKAAIESQRAMLRAIHAPDFEYLNVGDVSVPL